ncbi:hypothetical protein CRENBAI_004893 [Crenichthys baileyi]|uniref:Uncharacterized protein n=1 Tax=Crenichthys baileyi TaxID=28760 RepID=A0AAV9QSI7_9TELE
MEEHAEFWRGTQQLRKTGKGKQPRVAPPNERLSTLCSGAWTSRTFIFPLINMENESVNDEAEVSDEVLRLFNLDTEEQDFDGFSAQEEDEEADQ